MNSMPMIDDDFNFNEINLDFLESPTRTKSSSTISSNQEESHFKTPSPLKGKLFNSPINKALDTPLREFKIKKAAKCQLSVSKTEMQDFDFDFLNVSTQQENTSISPKPQYSAYNTQNVSLKIETECTGNSVKSLSKRIADVDELVRKLQQSEQEKMALQKQLKEFNHNVKEIQLFYNKEKRQRIEADTENKVLISKCQELETELAAKSLELDQVQAIVEENNGPLSYNELAVRYLKLAQKLEEERLLHWHDQTYVNDIKKFCKGKGLKVPAMAAVPRSPQKRKITTRKSDAEVQCNLSTASTAATDNENPLKVIQRNQATQYQNVETRNQGCQHIGTTTTRGTTTACFFKYHDVGINCTPLDLDPGFADLLEEMRTFTDDFACPISPIADVGTNTNLATLSPLFKTISPISPLQIKFNSIGINTTPEKIIQRKSIGTCTLICNVQRQVDFIQQQPISIKRSNSRPPSTTNLLYETVKDELNSRSSTSSPVNINLHTTNNQIPTLPLQPPTISFDELWQIFGHMLYGLLHRNRMPSIDNFIAPNNITSQQDFYNWLHTLYNQLPNVNCNISNLPRNDSSQFLNTAMPTDRSDSHASNNNTPLNFSNAAASQISPNIVKPTAQLGSFIDKGTYFKENTTKKSIGTSPIHCLNATHEEFPSSGRCTESPTTFSNVINGSKSSAFRSPNKREKPLNKNEIENVKTNFMEHIKSNSSKVLNSKSKLIKKRIRIKNPLQRRIIKTETAVDFLAKLHDFKEQSCSKNVQANETHQKELEKMPLKGQKLKKRSKSLRNLNLKLFGSDAETETETESESVTTLHLSTQKTEQSLNCSSTTTSFESNNSLSSDDEDQLKSLQLVENKIMKATSEQVSNQLELIESNQDEASGKMLHETKISKVNIPTNIAKCTFFDKDNSTGLNSTSKILTEQSVLTQKRGRKRKMQATEVEICTSPVKTPCKRSARLLAKQRTQEHRLQKQNNLQLLTLESLTKSNRKRITSVSDNLKEAPVENILTIETRQKSKEIKLLQTVTVFENFDSSDTSDSEDSLKLSILSNVDTSNSSKSSNSAEFENNKLKKLNTKDLVTTPSKESPSKKLRFNSTFPVSNSSSTTTTTSLLTSSKSMHLVEMANKIEINPISCSLLNDSISSKEFANTRKYDFLLPPAAKNSFCTTPYALKTISNTLTTTTSSASDSAVLSSSSLSFYTETTEPTTSTSSLIKPLESHSIDNKICTANSLLNCNKYKNHAYNLHTFCGNTNATDSEETLRIKNSVKVVGTPTTINVTNSPSTINSPPITYLPLAPNSSSLPTKSNTLFESSLQKSNLAPTSNSPSIVNLLRKSISQSIPNYSTYAANIPTTTYPQPTLNSSLFTNSSNNLTNLATINSFSTSTTTELSYINTTLSKQRVTQVNFDSPPSSPTPLHNNEIQKSSLTPIKIPLELSKSYFQNANHTWRPKSLLQNLIDVYDESHYHSLHDTKMNENENQHIKQMEFHINEYISEATMNIETKTKFDIAALNLVQKLQSITSEAEFIAKAIAFSIQKAKRPQINVYKTYTNETLRGTKTTYSSSISETTTTQISDPLINENFSTKAHQSIVYVFQHFNSNQFLVLLNIIETMLFNVKTCDGLSLDDVMNLTDLYLLILRQNMYATESIESLQLSNPARLFIAKCLYYHKLKAWPMIYAVLCAFPTVLPHREERSYDRSDPLITVIQHCLMCTTYDMNNSDLRQRELLSKLRFEYHFECFKPDFHETLKNLIEKLCASKLLNLKFAFAIFCKRLPPDRVIRDILQQHFIPLANEYYRLVQKLPDYESRLAILLNCFSTVIKPFPRDPANPLCTEVKNYFNFLKNFLNLNEQPLVQEAALHAILRLQRFDYVSCYHALAHLRFDSKLQPYTRAALKTFIYRKPKSFWKTIQMQSKI